ncbi:MAG TPA: hypothetical protein VMJ12_05705, partial [Candidatus Acidoferrales bacterium]|nr:hypothetical protein [Candidatus Acidoferrales bacterium]
MMKGLTGTMQQDGRPACLHPKSVPNRVLKNSFLTQKTCKNPNKIEGHFSRTWLFQHPANCLMYLGGSRR